MEISLNAIVECTDGVCGHSAYVLINPIIDQVTHLVVKDDAPPSIEYIVPIDLVIDAKAELIRLNCSQLELHMMEPFIKTTFIEEKIPDRYSRYGIEGVGVGSIYYMPIVTPDITIYESEETKQIPPGELAVHRGTRVEATDGAVGRVDELVVNSENSRITHLIMREGHLWGQKDVIIPVTAILPVDETHADTVFLNLDKQQIAALPTIPVHRLWS